MPCPEETQEQSETCCSSLTALAPCRWLLPWLALLLALLTTVSTAWSQSTVVLDLTNSVWSYNDAGLNLGTAWRNASYSAENAWPSGTGLFGVEGTDPYPYPAPVETSLVLGARRITYYFRTHFNFSGGTANLNLIANAYVDDGAVFYLNGTEVARVRMTNDPVYFTNKAQLASPEGVVSLLSLPTANLAQGDNVLAVEVHQSDPNSSDVLFGMSLEIVGSVAPNILTEPSDLTIVQEGTNTLSVIAEGFPALSYQWYHNNVPIPGANRSSLELFEYPAADGNYHVVITNSAGSATSRTATVVVVVVQPVITTPDQPADEMVLQDGSTTLSILAQGFPTPTYQWYRSGTAVAGATQPDIFLSSFPGDAGRYHVVVSNVAGTVTSRTNTVTYFPDTNAPTIVYALGRPSPSEVLIVFSEPIVPEDAVNTFAWTVRTADGLTSFITIEANRVNASSVIISTAEERQPSVSYVLHFEDLETVSDLHGNQMLHGNDIPIALFESELISLTNTVWRYDQSDTDLGTNWIGTGYDDASWSSGVGPFDAWRVFNSPSTCRDFLPGTGDHVNTCLTLSNASNSAQIPTSYFRTHFTFNGDVVYSVLRLRQIVNDGAVYYLNGVELFRNRMPAGNVTYNTLATIPAGDAGYEQFDVYAPSLRQGDNVLAVELHQVSLDSQDLTFGLNLIGILPTESSVQPELTITVNAGNMEIRWQPAAGTLLSTDDLNGTWTPVTVSDPPNLHIAPASDPRRFFRVVVP